jgi:hypothetical protein
MWRHPGSITVLLRIRTTEVITIFVRDHRQHRSIYPMMGHAQLDFRLEFAINTRTELDFD